MAEIDSHQSSISLHMTNLQESTTFLTKAKADSLVESFLATMYRHGLESGTEWNISIGEKSVNARIDWDGRYTDEIARTYPNSTATTDSSACAISLLTIPSLVNMRATATAEIGTRFDYYLESIEADDFNFLANYKFLEVTGISSKAGPKRITERLKQKIGNLDEPGGPGSTSGKTYISVAEFSTLQQVVILR